MRILSSSACSLLLIAVVSAACQSPLAPGDAETVVLAPGETGAFGALSVRFLEVTTDSRCPANALCIQQGDAFFAIDAQVRGAAASYDLQINDPAHRRVTHVGYAIEAGALEPYPFGDPIDPDDYRVTLVLTRE